MRRAVPVAALALALGGCGGSSSDLYSASSTKACLEQHDVSVSETTPPVLHGIAYEHALGSRAGVVVFARSEGDARTARRRLVELSRRDAQAMSPDEPADVPASLVTMKNVVVLWRRQSDRGVVFGCLR